MKQLYHPSSPKNRVLLIVVCMLSQPSYSQTWSPFGGGTGWVDALTVYDGELIAGGESGVLKWDGVSWTPIGGGVNDRVGGLTVYNAELWVSGLFSMAGGIPVRNIAKWNGTQWSNPGGGMDGLVGPMAVFNGDLIAGGAFSTAGGDSASRIARWNGTSWTALGNGLRGTQAIVMSLTVYNGELIAGGRFSTAGGVSVSNISKWNGVSWSPLGSGINTAAFTLAVYNGELIAGGDFSTAGGVVVNSIAKWNGTTWAALGSGCVGSYPWVETLTTHGTDLYVGGLFRIAGGITSNGIAKWNGSSWSPLGVGFASRGIPFGALAATLHNGVLVVGGDFDSAGGVSANNIAAWNGLADVGNSGGSMPTSFSLSQNYPNPWNPSTTIRYALPHASFVTLTVYNTLGQQVAQLVNEQQQAGYHDVVFRGDGLASGVYFYRLDAGNFTSVKKLLLLK